MFLDVVPDLLVVPVCQRVQLPEPEALVPTELRCAGASLRVDSADSRNPALGPVQGLAHGLDLPNPATRIRIAAPEISAVALLLLSQRDAGEPLEVDRVALGE